MQVGAEDRVPVVERQRSKLRRGTLMPAALTSTSTAPNRASTDAPIASTAAGSLTSQGKARIRRGRPEPQRNGVRQRLAAPATSATLPSFPRELQRDRSAHAAAGAGHNCCLHGVQDSRFTSYPLSPVPCPVRPRQHPSTRDRHDSIDARIGPALAAAVGPLDDDARRTAAEPSPKCTRASLADR